MDLTLRTLTQDDEQAFFDGLQEWAGESPHWYSFLWKEGMTYSEMLEALRKEQLGIDLAPDRVPHTMLYGFLDNQIIGRVSVRHTLNAELKRRGGHIGYAVAPKYRRKGYASEMVRQALNYCRTLNLDKIMITCADDNKPSWRIIEKLGGQLEAKVWDEVDEEMIRHYWITIK